MNLNGFRKTVLAQCWLLSWGVLAFVLRALPWKGFLGDDGRYLLYGPDGYDHLRRITLDMAQFPRIALFDSYCGYPVGTGQIWAPLFDYLFAAVTLLMGGGKVNPDLAMAIGFWAPPVLGGATVFLVYRVSVRFFGRRAALLSAPFIALLPGHLYYSFVAELDHHVAEPLVCLAIVGSVLRWGEAAGGDRWKGGLRTALWFVFGLMIWRGSVVFWGIAFAALGLQIALMAATGGDARPLVRYSTRTAVFAAVLLAPFSVSNVLGTSSGVSFGIVSWFQVILLLAAALLFPLLNRLLTPPFRSRPVFAAGGTLAALFVAILVTPFGKQFLAGLRVIFGSDPWLDMISELRPMLFPAGRLDLWHGTQMLSLVYWLLPVILASVFLRWRQGGYRDFRWSLLLVTGGTLWVLPLFRERYIHLAAVGVTLGVGYLIFVAREKIADLSSVPPLYRALPVVPFLLVLPVLPFLATLPAVALPADERVDLPRALLWLRDNTPRTSHFADPVKRPEYGVLADWGVGAEVEYLAERPVVATNFGWETHGLLELTSFLTGTDPHKALDIAADNGVRYILLNNLHAVMPQYNAIAEFLRQKKGLAAAATPLLSLSDNMYYRLYVQDATFYRTPRGTERALGNYRLVYESSGGWFDPQSGFLSSYKLFERVSGALVVGYAPAGSPVAVDLSLQSPHGRIVVFHDEIVTGAGGEFSFRLPYPTDRNSGVFSPRGMYRLSLGGRTFNVAVTEDAVIRGGNVAYR